MILRPPPPPATALSLAAVLLSSAALAQPQPVPPPPLPAQPVPAPAAPVPPSQALPSPPRPVPSPAQPVPFPAQPMPAPPPPWSQSPNEEPPASVPQPPAEPPPGVTAKGLPYYQRGAVLVEVAGMLQSQSQFANSPPLTSFDIVAHIPVLPTTFVDLDLPFGFGAIGNPMMGAHHVFRPDDHFWITLGGAFGFPLMNGQSLGIFAFANGLWDAERFVHHNVPFALRLGLEGHVGIAELRAELDPVWGASVSDSADHFFAFQHAVEIQIGHTIAGGLRYQGVLVATDNPELVDTGTPDMTGFPTTDRYQGVLEPFFKLYHDPVFMRVGLLLPVDAPLGPPFKQGWGVRGTIGWSLD